MKCKKCNTTMEKDPASRTATCPCCGRTVHYRTKAEERCNNNNYYSGNDNGNGGKRKGHGCLIFVIVVIILLVLSPILLLRLIFGSGIWAVLGGTVSFLGKIKPKPDYPLKTLYPRAFQTGLNRLIYYDFTTVE